MVSKRTLPERRNPLIEPDSSPHHEILVERRRLGQTNLALKPGVVGVTNASKPENTTGVFDYAHLRVPLPKDLAGSGIFTLKNNVPESYFLMRRSSDGYISATGMFKAAFPWASILEEETERRHQKSFSSAGPEEVAGSVWIEPEEALTLADEYGMRLWIEALLDPSPIERGNKDRHNQISMPPRFDINKAAQPAAPVVLPPSSGLRTTRARSTRSASPSKIATPSRKMASPRKSRSTRSSAKPEATKAEEVIEATRPVSASGSWQNVVENGTNASESIASESINGEVKEPENVRIKVQETIEHNGDVETTTTNVEIDVPADYPELPVPEDTEKMIEEAKKMVEQARELEGAAEVNGTKASSKRKAEELSRDEDEVEPILDERPAKQARYTTEQKLKKEKMTARALLGLGVMTAFGMGVQYYFGA